MAKKVICAMSGGLDSSVASALLKKAGFDVIGVFMKFWSEPRNDGLGSTNNRCCSPEAEIKARKVAKILKIPFYVFDFSKEFKEKVVDYFLESHKNGITPNPCVICNKEIKFGLLIEKALNLGVDFIATGHYARVLPKIPTLKIKKRKLLRAKDKRKDQSYFLWMLTQEQLKRVIFPIGDYKREEVEKLAKKFNLPIVFGKKSVEICFISGKLNNFLKRYLGEKEGEILTKDGKILGKHKGLWFYTIGQRKGLFLQRGPFYVLSKDFKNNSLIVTHNEKDLFQKELIATNVNWISGKEPKLPLKIEAKIRYQSELSLATVFKINSQKYKVVFQKSQRAITPGQSIVFYKGQELIGGGIISLNEK